MIKETLNTKDYNANERVDLIVPTKKITKAVEDDLRNCCMCGVVDAVIVIGKTWNLRPNRANEFKIIKRIVINSVKNN